MTDLIAVFGLGLVGSSVRNALRALAPGREVLFPLCWDDPGLQQRQLHDITCRITDCLSQTRSANSHDAPSNCSGVPHLHVVWSAGRAGFQAGDGEVAAELDSFRAVVERIEEVQALFPPVPVTFHHVSSIGGLFEGQRVISRNSVPSARRPYGRLKFCQEQIVRQMPSRIGRRIYRLTSVVGPARGSFRQGLIAKLIDDGVHHRVTCLVGQLTTLRDYVWHEDIGRYVARSILAADEQSQAPLLTRVLASAKPSSIYEVVELVESFLGRRLYTRQVALPTNDSDITISTDVLPDNWCATDLKTCVAKVYHEALSA